MLTGERYFTGGTFISTFLPELTLRLPLAFIYVGHTHFILNQSATVDRHHFVDVSANGRIQRMVILHFESFLPNIDDTFNYKIPEPPDQAGPNYRFSPAKISIGGHQYIHNTWFFNAAANIQRNPQGELARTAQLLTEHTYLLPGEVQMSRYVRVVDENRKSEVILFYLEPLQGTGYKVEDFVKNGRGETHFDQLSAELTVRSGKLFENAIIS